jgi:hypothetical protein
LLARSIIVGDGEVPVRAPAAVGVKTIEMVQAAPGASGPHVFVCEKSPDVINEEKFRVVEPAFVTVRL